MNAELDWGKSNLKVHLKLRGGWGMDNLTSACSWIANGVRWRTAKNSTFVIHTGRGFADNSRAVLDGTVDFAFTTPIVAADMALKGRGLFNTPHPNLLAVAALPHRDRLVLAVDAEVADRYDLHTFRDFVTKCPPLRIATGSNDDGNFVGYSVGKVLNAHGMAWEDLERWGGQWLTAETPRPVLSWFANGNADALFHEAIMIWPRFMGQKLMRFLPIEVAVLEELHEQYGYGRADIELAQGSRRSFHRRSLEPGDFVGVEQPVPTLDFSQWLLVTREEVPEELVNLVTSVIVEDRDSFESRYRQQQREQSALYYPIKPEEICQTGPIPLHSGAERYYRKREQGETRELGELRELREKEVQTDNLSEQSPSAPERDLFTKRQPMKTNVFQHLISHTGVPGITSLFPYLHPGAIVVGGVYSLNYPGSPEFNFHHTNDCDELFISLVSNQFQQPFGMLAVGARTHEVNNHTGTHATNPDGYSMALVVQRNKEQPPQREVFSIYCPNEECKKLVFRKVMDNFEGEQQPYYPEFKTLTVLGPDAVNEFNQSDRTCHNCGTVLPHFPVEDMSWSLYTRQVRLANRARADYERFLANQSLPHLAGFGGNKT